MASSGTTAFTLNMVELFEEAFERAAGRELRTGYEFRTAMRSYNLLSIEWQNRGYNLWTVETSTVALVEDDQVVELPDDTVDVVEATVADSSDQEIALTRISLPTWAAQVDKDVSGRPTQMLVTRDVSGVSLTLWPKCDGDYTLRTYRTRRIEDAGTGVSTPDMPSRFLPPLVAGLAYHLAMKIPEAAERVSTLKAVYDELFDQASEEDRDKADMRIVPMGRRI